MANSSVQIVKKKIQEPHPCAACLSKGAAPEWQIQIEYEFKGGPPASQGVPNLGTRCCLRIWLLGLIAVVGVRRGWP